MISVLTARPVPPPIFSKLANGTMDHPVVYPKTGSSNFPFIPFFDASPSSTSGLQSSPVTQSLKHILNPATFLHSHKHAGTGHDDFPPGFCHSSRTGLPASSLGACKSLLHTAARILRSSGHSLSQSLQCFPQHWKHTRLLARPARTSISFPSSLCPLIQWSTKPHSKVF